MDEWTLKQIEDDPILKHFHYSHLPVRLQNISKIFFDAAESLIEKTERNAERSVALRKLLEAKDAAVRSAL